MGKSFESFVWSVEVELSEDMEAKGSEEKSLESEQQVIPEPETQDPALTEEESALKELLQVEYKYASLITLVSDIIILYLFGSPPLILRMQKSS
ncbi:hypothetical protein HF086_018047 [Spodoptera exigua]|uniref:Uncharacterized protein n=1 Tax=Spodoptera exigua TaxID=7107 RepID=A0A922N025_SPOEX|nr:hypothetical protein HF086_018047 [Spodoptera exigua]